MAYSKYYPEGWKNNESGGTPITAGALNHMETGIKTAVDNMDNTGSNVVTYTSEDQADSAVTRSTGWTTVSALVSGMTHSNLFNSMSKMFKNIRWLYKMLGTTDISSISSAGTVTGAIAKLNTELGDKVIIEFQTEPTFTVAANTATNVFFRHSKTGYKCYFLAYSEYRSSAVWWTHTKNYGQDGVTLDIINQGSAFTVTTAQTAWLCIKD